MKVFNYIINKLDLRICKPSDNFTIFHFHAFFSNHFTVPATLLSILLKAMHVILFIIKKRY